MKYLIFMLCLFAAAAAARSQTNARSVMHVNGVVVSPTNFWANAPIGSSGGGPWLTNTNAMDFRNAIGLTLPALTNTNVTNFRAAIGLGETNNVNFQQISINDVFANGSFISVGNSVQLSRDTSRNDGVTVYFTGSRRVYVGTGGVDIYSGSLNFSNNAVGASVTRTNLGLGWSALTNTNAATRLLGVNTSGQVVYSEPMTFTNPATFTQNLTFTNAGITFQNWTNTVTIGLVDYDGSSFYFGAVANSVGLFSARPSGLALLTPLNFEGPNAGLNKAITRTNLDLGGGITTNRTFVSYNGTNYTTNSVTISNGVITGWTQ